MIGQKIGRAYKSLYQEGGKFVIQTRQKAGATLIAKFADLANAQAFYKLIVL